MINFDSNVEARLLSMLSLARKAGKLATGEEGCEKAISKREAKLILVATDASQNTKKKFTNKANHYKVPLYSLFTKEVMGKHIGVHSRATIVVTDSGFAAKILEFIKKGWVDAQKTCS